jgi:hypothetical protein
MSKNPWQIRFNKVCFTIFKANLRWNIFIFEFILLLEIQKNCKKWVWKEKNN